METNEQNVPIAVDQENKKMEAVQVDSSEVQSDGASVAVERSMTTWRWHRRKKAWVEVSVKPDEAGASYDAGSTDTNDVDGYYGSSLLAAPVQRIQQLRSVWGRSPIKGTALRVIDALSSRDRVGASSRLLIKDAEIRAESIIAVAEDRARAMADRIVLHAEQRAEERVESIITRAEEKALEKAINIIVSAEERAEALAEHIISRAEELAQARAAKLIALTGNRGQQSESLTASTEKQYSPHDMVTVAGTQDMKRQVIADTRRQAEQLLKVADDELKEIKAQVVEEIKDTPVQKEHRMVEADYDEKEMPCKGTVELIIEPPVNYGIAKKVLKRMAVLQGVKVLDFGGSTDKGVRIKLMSTNIVRLPFRIMDIPEIEKATVLPMGPGKTYPWQRLTSRANKKNGHPDSRILIKLGKKKS